MPKIHQVLAIEAGTKKTSNAAIDINYKLIQKPDLFNGLSKVYNPENDSDNDTIAKEEKLVQARAESVLENISRAYESLLDIAFTKEEGNTTASADVIVDGVTLLPDAPATYLLWLSKQLVDIHTIISKFPVLDPAERWELDSNTHLYKTSEPVVTRRLKKVPYPFLKAPATEKHPAQVEVVMEDVLVGKYELVKFSGALPSSVVASMLEQCQKVQQAVKVALAEANSTEVESMKVSGALLDFIFTF